MVGEKFGSVCCGSFLVSFVNGSISSMRWPLRGAHVFVNVFAGNR